MTLRFSFGLAPARCVHFFFSSRRRHTRYIGDWSSDVCSSDLAVRYFVVPGDVLLDEQARFGKGFQDPKLAGILRSEERRVGKECRARWWQYHYKKNKTILLC